MKGCCAECTYYDEDQVLGRSDAGRCLRYAPRARASYDDLDRDYWAEWPIVREDDGCGEFVADVPEKHTTEQLMAGLRACDDAYERALHSEPYVEAHT